MIFDVYEITPQITGMHSFVIPVNRSDLFFITNKCYGCMLVTEI